MVSIILRQLSSHFKSLVIALSFFDAIKLFIIANNGREYFNLFPIFVVAWPFCYNGQ